MSRENDIAMQNKCNEELNVEIFYAAEKFQKERKKIL